MRWVARGAADQEIARHQSRAPPLLGRLATRVGAAADKPIAGGRRCVRADFERNSPPEQGIGFRKDPTTRQLPRHAKAGQPAPGKAERTVVRPMHVGSRRFAGALRDPQITGRMTDCWFLTHKQPELRLSGYAPGPPPTALRGPRWNPEWLPKKVPCHRPFVFFGPAVTLQPVQWAALSAGGLWAVLQPHWSTR